MVTNLLLTGHPGVGKTTLLKKLVQRFARLALTGFYTEEIREESRRIGFRVVALNGSSAVFAHRDFHTRPEFRLGKYGVKPEIFEKLVAPHLEADHKNADLVVVDEIAKMELLSAPFREVLVRVLDSKRPVLGTIALRGTGLIKRIKERADVEIFHVTLQNRDVLGEQIHRRLLQVL